MKHLFYLIILLAIVSSCSKTETFQWRGDNRDGIFNEKNLLKSWPADGPKLLWEYEGIGNGFGTPLITDKFIYVNGEIDSTGYMFAFDLKGKFLWKSAYGKEWMFNFPGSRCTPTIIGNNAYICSGMGDVTCLNAENGNKIWSVDMVKDLHGKLNRFGYSQSLAMDGDKLFCEPGGPDTNVVALNRMNGQLIWTSKATGETCSYTSPRVFQHGKRKILTSFSEHAVWGIDAETGEFLWAHKQDTLADVHGNTPIYENGFLYCTAGAGNMTEKLQLSEDSKSVSKIWKNKRLDNTQGGCVKVGNELIGTMHRKPFLKRVDCETGMTIDSLGVFRGSTIFADGMVYVYNEKGEVHLVNPKPGQMESAGSFKITKGTLEHFAHPAIHNGVLYIRHGNYLAAYDIKNQ